MNQRIQKIVPGSTPELAEIEARILKERGRISPLYQVLLNSPEIAKGWEALLTAVRNKSSLPARLRELMILRVAVLNRAQFEFDAHAPIAIKEGVSQAQLEELAGEQLGFFGVGGHRESKREELRRKKESEGSGVWTS